MIIEKFLDDVIMIKNNTFFDDRGFFFESFNLDVLETIKNKNTFIQDNISYSKEKFTIRGLHYQKEPYTQGKFIYLISGSILDVFVDARPFSKNFGKHYQVKLEEFGDSIYIPRGYLHGFCTLSENTFVGYKVDNSYNKDLEVNILWDDIDLKIDWGIASEIPFLSKKDKNAISWETFIKGIENNG